jgi:hypothetical protein
MRRMLIALVLGFLCIAVSGHAATIALAWDASSTPQVRYRLYYGDAPGLYHTVIDAGVSLTLRVESLTSETTYFFAVTAYQGAAESGYSNEVQVTPTDGDRTTPEVMLITPGNGARVKRNTTLTLSAYATDDVELVSVEFLIDGSRRCLLREVPYDCAWAIPARRNRTYLIDVIATDTSGNIGSAKTVRVTTR